MKKIAKEEVRSVETTTNEDAPRLRLEVRRIRSGLKAGGICGAICTSNGTCGPGTAVHLV